MKKIINKSVLLPLLFSSIAVSFTYLANSAYYKAVVAEQLLFVAWAVGYWTWRIVTKGNKKAEKFRIRFEKLWFNFTSLVVICVLGGVGVPGLIFLFFPVVCFAFFVPFVWCLWVRV